MTPVEEKVTSKIFKAKDTLSKIADEVDECNASNLMELSKKYSDEINEVKDIKKHEISNEEDNDAISGSIHAYDSLFKDLSNDFRANCSCNKKRSEVNGEDIRKDSL